MMPFVTTPLDCPADDRCWIRHEGGIELTEKGACQLYQRGIHNGLSTTAKKNASAMMVTTVIDGVINDWMTVYPNEKGEPHEEFTDYFKNRTVARESQTPMAEFFSRTKGKSYQGVLEYDSNPRAPLETDSGKTEDLDSPREHTIRFDLCRAARESKHDHFLAVVIRPLVILNIDRSIEDPEGMYETVAWPMMCKYILDRRGEGEFTEDDYYVQLYEIIASDDSQKAPPMSAIAKANANTTSNHNFNPESVPLQMLLTKFHRAQVDIRQSRFQRLIPKADGKKRARAVSARNLVQFTTNVTD